MYGTVVYGTDRCMLRATGAVAPDGALFARVDVRASDDATEAVWIDWLAVQLCGFCSPTGSRPRWHGHAAGSGGGRHDDATALVDEATASEAAEYCVIASEPQIMGVGVALRHGQPHHYCVRAQLPPTAPPSFEGTAICCEYALIVTLRTTSLPTRSLLGWMRGRPNDWVRGPLRQLHLPLHVQCSAEWVRTCRAQGTTVEAPQRCALHCTEMEHPGPKMEHPAPQMQWPDGVKQTSGGADTDADVHEQEDGDGDSDGDSDDGEGDNASDDGSGGGSGDDSEGDASVLACVPAQLRVDGRAFACVKLLGSVWRVGGAVRGVLSWPSTVLRCSKVLVELQVEEHEGVVATGGPTPAVTTATGAPDACSGDVHVAPPIRPSAAPPPPLATLVAGRTELGSTGGAPLRRASFEVALPTWLPPTSHLHAAGTAGTAGVALRWVLRFTFDVSLRGAPGSCQPQHLPWTVPLQVLAVARHARPGSVVHVGQARNEATGSQEAQHTGVAVDERMMAALSLRQGTVASAFCAGAQTPPPLTVEMSLDVDGLR